MNGKNIFLVLEQKQIQMLVFCLHPVLCAQGSEEVGKRGLSSLLCLQGAELAGRAWGWQTFPGQQPPLQAHRFHIPGQLLLAAHPACLHTVWLDWPMPSPPLVVNGPSVPMDLLQGPSLPSRCFDSFPGP